jgi:hypothetical protein
MDDIENMLKKEPATDFNWTANVSIQFTNGQQTAVHVPEGSEDTHSCAASIEDNAESDTANVALSHEFSLESDSDALPRRHFNKELFGNNGWLDQTNTTKTGSKRRVSSGLKGLGQTVKAHIKDLVSGSWLVDYDCLETNNALTDWRCQASSHHHSQPQHRNRDHRSSLSEHRDPGQALR